MNTLSFATGTGMFELRHILSMLVCAILIVVLSILVIKKNPSEKFILRTLLVCGIVSETIKVISYILMNEAELGGYLPKTDIPFHLCSLQIILIFILNFSKNEKLKDVIKSFMMPTCLFGGILAIILATSSARSSWAISFQYYLYHVAISVFAIYLLSGKNKKFTIKDFRNSLIMLVATFFLAIYINSILCTKETLYSAVPLEGYVFDETIQLYTKTKFMNINYMYVVNPPQDGLPFLNENHGWLVYIVHFALTGVFVFALCYIKPIIEAIKSLFKK